MTSVFAAVISISIFHTLANPMHYLPIVALGKARKWGIKLTCLIAIFAAAGHLAGFCVAAALGIWAGEGIKAAEQHAEHFEHFGVFAFLIFGAAYTVYGIFYALKHKKCGDDTCGCARSNIIAGEDAQSTKYMLLLFAMYALGPCAFILPMVFYFAANCTLPEIAALGIVYYICTASVTALCTGLIYKGASLIKFDGHKIEIWAHAISGAIITLSVIVGIFTDFHQH